MDIREAARRCGATMAIGALVAGCGAPQPRGKASLAAHGTGASAATASARESVELMELSHRLGLVGLGIGSAGHGSAGLVASSDFGRSFTAIGPRTAAGTVIDGVSFPSRMDGWLAVHNVSTTRETLYRTRNGGHSWRAFVVGYHSDAAGSADSIQFLTSSVGWLTVTQPTAPREDLLMTRDGGRSWRLVARAPQGRLPDLGPVAFEPGGQTGWQAGRTALWRTTDRGRAWQQAAIHASAGSRYGLPARFGRTLLEPVAAANRHELRLYRSTDGGSRWSLTATLPTVIVSPGTGAWTAPPVSIPAPEVAWAAAARGHHTIVYRTTDRGRRWAAGMIPGSTPRNSAMQLQALDATHAWLLDATTGRVYATSNGGSSWHRIDSAALAAG